MIEDVAPKLLKEIQKDFEQSISKSAKINKLYKKIRDGTATYEEAYTYSNEIGKCLSSSFEKYLSSKELPDGKMYFNIADRVVRALMEEAEKLIIQTVNQIQKSLNKRAGIGIKPIQPKKTDRIKGIIDRLSSEDDFDHISWILKAPVETYCRKVVDDAVEANAEFHYKSGMRAKIVRKMTGKCCDWCAAVSGTYSYPDVPKDVYRRHDNCRCTVLYDPGDGKIQDVHTKEWDNQNRIKRIKKAENFVEKDSKNDRIKLAKKFENEEKIRKFLKLKNTAKVSFPAKKIDVEILRFDAEHINKERERNVTKDDATKWIKNSLFSVNVWNGKYERFFANDGAVYVDLKNNLIRTAYSRDDFTKNIVECLEMLENEKY